MAACIPRVDGLSTDPWVGASHLTHTVTYSWGGAVLAHTYRELCRASLDRRRGISGCITLIQVCKFFC